MTTADSITTAIEANTMLRVVQPGASSPSLSGRMISTGTCSPDTLRIMRIVRRSPALFDANAPARCRLALSPWRPASREDRRLRRVSRLNDGAPPAPADSVEVGGPTEYWAAPSDPMCSTGPPVAAQTGGNSPVASGANPPPGGATTSNMRSTSTSSRLAMVDAPRRARAARSRRDVESTEPRRLGMRPRDEVRAERSTLPRRLRRDTDATDPATEATSDRASEVWPASEVTPSVSLPRPDPTLPAPGRRDETRRPSERAFDSGLMGAGAES